MYQQQGLTESKKIESLLKYPNDFLFKTFQVFVGTRNASDYVKNEHFQEVLEIKILFIRRSIIKRTFQ